MSLSLIKCPKCRQTRFDPWCGSCERRQCGYVFERCSDCPHDLCVQGWKCLRGTTTAAKPQSPESAPEVSPGGCPGTKQ